MTELVILGGGPAGVSAGVYAARKQINSILITDDFGGQSIVSEDIQNWIGTPHIKGADLAKNLEAHVREYAGTTLEIRDKTRVTLVEKKGETFIVHVQKRGKEIETIETKSVLVTTGSIRRKLEAVGADTFEHKGLTYCASCDGLFFAGQDVVVVGGGNAGLESALQLAAYCTKVYVFNRTTVWRADPVTLESAKKKANIILVENVVVDEIKGTQFVEGILYTENGEKKELALSGVFVEIGQMPNTEYVKDVVERNAVGNIVVDPRTQRASVTGVWAAGDCTDGLYHQNNIAAGDAVKALEDIYVWLQK
ncbi:MAG: FAD-dependent oxidoreductase [Patescibacteria group bacterium]